VDEGTGWPVLVLGTLTDGVVAGSSLWSCVFLDTYF
jgi:hypothetical protein